MMNSVRCPICEQRIVSEDSAELSANLRSHLERRHDIAVQEKSGRFSSPMGSAQERGGTIYASEPPREGYKGAQHRREEQFWSPEEESKVPPRPKGLGDWARKSVGANEEAGGREEWTRGTGYPSMMQPSSREPVRERTMGGMECPLCGRQVSGRNEDDLSMALEEHFRSEHRIEPRVTAR